MTEYREKIRKQLFLQYCCDAKAFEPELIQGNHCRVFIKRDERLPLNVDFAIHAWPHIQKDERCDMTEHGWEISPMYKPEDKP